MGVELTRQTFLALGEKEFLRCGFHEASLRGIAKEAGLTLGAFYRYWPSKDALFDELVKEPAEALLAMYVQGQKAFQALSPQEQVAQIDRLSREGMMKTLRYMLEHPVAFKLLLCRSAGSRWADYYDRLVALEAEGSRRFMEEVQRGQGETGPVDGELARVLACAEFQAIVTILERDTPTEQALRIVEKIHDFQTAGWKELLEN